MTMRSPSPTPRRACPSRVPSPAFFMNANMVPWAIYPDVMQSPINPGTGYPATSTGVITTAALPSVFIGGTNYYWAALQPANNVANIAWLGNRLDGVKNNQMFDLGLNLTYKIDWLSAYLNFAKNIGSVKTASRQIVALQGTAGGATVPLYGSIIGNTSWEGMGPGSECRLHRLDDRRRRQTISAAPTPSTWAVSTPPVRRPPTRGFSSSIKLGMSPGPT